MAVVSLGSVWKGLGERLAGFWVDLVSGRGFRGGGILVDKKGVVLMLGLVVGIATMAKRRLQKRARMNWEGKFLLSADHVHYPGTVEDVVDIIKNAKRTNEHVKVIGAGHSWSDIAVCDNTNRKTHLVSLDNLGRLIEVDAVAKTVIIQAGMRLYALNDLLHQHGLALPNLGSISEQSVAGAFATGTHGTGINHKILASTLLELELVNANGDVVTCSRDNNRDLFLAASVGLGALGIVTRVKLQVTDAFSVETIYVSTTLTEVLQNMNEHLTQNEWFKFWWVPYTDSVKLFVQHRTSQKSKLKLISNFITWFEQRFSARYVFEPLIGSLTSSTTLTRSAFKTLAGVMCNSRGNVSERSDHGLNLFYIPIHAEAEYAVPVAHIGDYLRDVERKIQEENLHVNFMTEVRFVASDDIWMSPAFGNPEGGGWSFVTFMTYNLMHDEKTIKYFKWAEELSKKYQGRTHWAKTHTMKPEYLQTVLPHFNDFCELRRRMDPDGMFLNDYLRRTLGINNV